MGTQCIIGREFAPIAERNSMQLLQVRSTALMNVGRELKERRGGSIEEVRSVIRLDPYSSSELLAAYSFAEHMQNILSWGYSFRSELKLVGKDVLKRIGELIWRQDKHSYYFSKYIRISIFILLILVDI